MERQVFIMGLSASDMVAAAKAEMENLSPEQVAQELESGNATLIDIREENELKDTGRIPGSHHAPRGMLEFYADPSGPYHREEFDPESRIILTCSAGGRSALAAQTLKQMGYTNVAHLETGVTGWIEQGLPTEQES
jgi:rhodanese-related sulfurtransferase